MRRTIRLALLLIATTATYAQAQQHPRIGPPEPTGNARPEDPLQAKMREAGAAFYRQDYVRALRLFNEVLQKSPDNIVALNMSGSCSLQLHDYPSAIERFKLALAFHPGEYHNVAGLLEAYSLAHMEKERAQELEYVKQLKREGKLPANFSFVTDFFDMGDRRLQVMEFFPELAGRDNYRYWFNVFNLQGQQTYRITLQSNDHDQLLWAKTHAGEAAAGKRVFSLDGYTPNSHTRYRFYDGEPPYDAVVADVQLILQGKLKGMSPSASPATAGDQPSPGPGTSVHPK